MFEHKNVFVFLYYIIHLIMCTDRNEIGLRREDENDFHTKDSLTIFRPDDRIYPQKKWFIPGEVVKLRIIDKPWNDLENIAPKFSNIEKLVKIQAIKVLEKKELTQDDFEHSLSYVQSPEDVSKYIKNIYNKDPEIITKIDIKEIESKNLIDNTNEIKERFTSWRIQLAELPENNVKNIDELLQAKNFSIALINHDYAGITPKMRNHIANKYGLDIKTAFVVADPKDFEKILDMLQKSNKYIWGGLGVGFKDTWRKTVKEKPYGFINPVADEMQSINFIAHFWDEIHWANSDASGYTDSLSNKFKEIGESITDKHIIILWAGGTARGIALELANRWAGSITILNRTKEKAQHIADNLNKAKQGIAIAGDEHMIFDLQDKHIDAIINLSTKWADGDFAMYSWLMSTEWGIEKNISDTKTILGKLKANNPKLIISDINLTKTQTTPLLDMAKEEWLATLDGKLMVIYQWVQAIWTVFGDKIIQAWGTKEEVQEELLKIINH